MSKAVGHVEDHSHDFTWDLDIDTNDTTTSLKLPLQTRFGDIVLEVTVPEPQHIRPSVTFASVEPGSLGCAAKPSAELHWISDENDLTPITTRSWSLCPIFPPRPPQMSRYNATFKPKALEKAEKSAPRFERLSHRRFRFVVSLRKTVPSAALLHAIPSRQIKLNSAATLLTKRPNDLRLVFLTIGAELWTCSSFLSASSPYFKTLLESDDFTESVRRRRKRPKIEEGALTALDGNSRAGSRARSATASEWNVEGDGGGGDDSDEETDDFIKRRSPPSVEEGGDDGDFTYREVKISQTPYSTYRAVLLYLHSGDITFAPLSSTLLPLNPRANQTREQLLDKHLSSTPALPFPVSPKSVYRLADLLEIPTLCALSLAELKSQLTASNAARELFSSITVYDDAREILLDFAVEHWKEVKRSSGMEEVQAKVKAGELPEALVVYADLLPRVS